LDDADALTAPGRRRKRVELGDRARVERRRGRGRCGRGRVAGEGGRRRDGRRRSARPRLEAEGTVHERLDRRGQPERSGTASPRAPIGDEIIGARRAERRGDGADRPAKRQRSPVPLDDLDPTPRAVVANAREARLVGVGARRELLASGVRA